jgi:hypothetical protein
MEWRGGRHVRSRSYTKDTPSKDFRTVRARFFPDEENLPERQRRTVMDFRRSGSVEAIARAVELCALATKAANSIDTNKRLQQTYLPNQTAVVRLADAARERGRVVMRGGKYRRHRSRIAAGAGSRIAGENDG